MMSTDVSSPSSKFAGDYECPEAKAIMQHLSGMPALRLSSSATDDSALGAKLWVEREKMAMVENENNHFRKQQVPHPQELELGESAGVSTKASAMMMSRFSNSLRLLNDDVANMGETYKKKLTAYEFLQHPVVQKEISKCEVDPEYDQVRGEEGDMDITKNVMDTVLKQHKWVHKRMMSRATEILTNARVATEMAVSKATQRYNIQMEHIKKWAARHGSGDVKELGEGQHVGMAEEAQEEMRSTESATMGYMKKVKAKGLSVIKSIYAHLKHPDEKHVAKMACDIIKQLKQKRLERHRSLVKKTRLQPHRIVTLPTAGEAAGAGRLTCAHTNAIEGDIHGYGYAGGNNCGVLKEQILSQAQAEKIKRGNNNVTVTLFRNVLESAVWQDKNIRWSQPSPKDQTMTRASYMMLGDQYGMSGPRHEEVSNRRYTQEWLSSCPKTCRSCNGAKGNSEGDDCYHQNLHRNYPLPMKSLVSDKHKSFDSLIRSSPVVTGVAILNLNDQGVSTLNWPYGWRKQIMRESVSKGGFWNSNTAVGPYVRCGVCKTTTCISNANGYKFTYYSKRNTNQMCSKEEFHAQGLPENKSKSKECAEHDLTSQYCTTKSRAECMYVQYCQRSDWNCDSHGGWSDPIYDCSKLISNTGITGDEWCAQLV